MASAYWLMVGGVSGGISSGSVGALRKPLTITQVMVNLGIMVVGEWFVTDSIVAYCSHYWHGRYLNNIPRAWQRISRKEHWGKVLVLVAVMTSTVVFIQAPDELCYTG